VYILAFSVLVSLACGPLAGKTPDAPPPVSPTPQPATEPTATAAPTATPAATPAPTPADQEEGGEVLVEVEDMDLLACPAPGSSMLLKFSANIIIDAEDVHLEHNLDDGVLNLSVNAGSDASQVALSGVEKPSIPYEMNGAMGDCTLTGEGKMSPSASGICQDGVVYLTIVEDWGPYQGTMTCPKATIPLSIPAMGQMTHSGADGKGEVFYLDQRFSGEGAGYTSIRPFQGPGSGDHIWTLFYDYTGPVVP
jgi:hypothetical protein